METIVAPEDAVRPGEDLGTAGETAVATVTIMKGDVDNLTRDTRTAQSPCCQTETGVMDEDKGAGFGTTRFRRGVASYAALMDVGCFIDDEWYHEFQESACRHTSHHAGRSECKPCKIECGEIG